MCAFHMLVELVFIWKGHETALILFWAIKKVAFLNMLRISVSYQMILASKSLLTNLASESSFLLVNRLLMNEEFGKLFELSTTVRTNFTRLL